MKILIVDDSKIITKKHKRTLEGYLPDAEYVIFNMPKQAVEEITASGAGKFDLIFLDYNMPEMDGIALAEHILSAGWVETVDNMVMVSANIQKAVEEKAKGVGLSFMAKPLEEKELEEFLKNRGAL